MDLFTIQKRVRGHLTSTSGKELNPDLFSLLHENSWAGKEAEGRKFPTKQEYKEKKLISLWIFRNW